MNNYKGIFQSCGAVGRLCIFRSEEGMEEMRSVGVDY